MEEQIYVKGISTPADSELITKYMNNSAVFFNKTSRFTASSISCLIYRDSEPIGFLNIGDEGLSRDNILFLDILVDEKYRNRGYAAKAYSNFKSRYQDNYFIIAETKETNIGANKSLEKNGVKFYSYNGLNYYLMDTNRLEELKNSESYERLIAHIHREKMSAYQYALSIRNC